VTRSSTNKMSPTKSSKSSPLKVVPDPSILSEGDKQCLRELRTFFRSTSIDYPSCVDDLTICTTCVDEYVCITIIRGVDHI
jgi:hypothetical protein